MGNMMTPAPSSSPTPVPSASPTGCSNDPNPLAFPGKRGACFTLRDPGKPGSYVENMPKVITLKPYWNFSWGAKRVAAQPSDIELVPMLWGGNNAASLAGNLQLIQDQINNGTAFRVLGFNEPDRQDQSNMLVEIAVAAWPNIEALGLPMVSPSPASRVGT